MGSNGEVDTSPPDLCLDAGEVIDVRVFGDQAVIDPGLSQEDDTAVTPRRDVTRRNSAATASFNAQELPTRS